ncbi:hypothetical protein ACFLRH_01070 [Actinomycetota bacterium]
MSERPILATIESTRTGPLDTVTVVLAYRDQTHAGTASASVGADIGNSLKLVAEAAASAIEAQVAGEWNLEVRAVALAEVGDQTVCLVQVADLDAGDQLFGVAGVGNDDIEKAMARAVLDATNRRMAPKLDND